MHTDAREGASECKSYIVSPQYCDMEGKKLHGYDCEYALQAVHGVRNLYVLVAVLARFLIALRTDENRTTLDEDEGEREREREKVQSHL